VFGLNELILPLLGGYLFVTQYFATRYLAPQWSGYRLFFNSAIAGASFFGVSVIITTLIKQGFPEIQKLISQIFPSVYPYLDASVLAFALGSVSWVIFNFFAADKEDLAIKYAEKFGGPLQVLLAKAVKETRQVSITLKSGKVYIGFVTKLNEAQDNKEYILIWPQRSGYRDSNTKKVTFTTNYAPVYQQIEDNSDEFENITIDDFQTAIPTSELESISIFDSKVSEAFRI